MSSRKIIITENLKKVLSEIKDEISNILLQEEIDESILSHPEKNVNYLDLSQSCKGHISYLTKDKIEKIEQEDNNYWNVKLRYHARPGSVIKKLFKFSDSHISLFTTQFLSIVDPPIYTMKVVSGDEIVKYYNHKNYRDTQGSLGMSCMKASPPEFFDIYTQNEKQINMLVMLDQHEKVMGRALLWNGDGFKLLDRIYVCNDLHVNYFYKWAIENNCYYKEFNNWYTPKHFIFKDQKIFKEFEIYLDKCEFERYPYLDTFKWLDKKNCKLYNYIPEKDNKNIITLSDYMGSCFDGNLFSFCDISQNLYSSIDVVHVGYMGKNVYRGDLVHSNVLDTFIYLEHSIFDEDSKDHIFNLEYDRYNDWDLINKKRENIKNKEKVSKNTSTKEIQLSGELVDWSRFGGEYETIAGPRMGICDIDETIQSIEIGLDLTV